MSELIGSAANLSTSGERSSTWSGEVVSTSNDIVPAVTPNRTTPTGMTLVKSGAPGAAGFMDGSGRILLGQYAGSSMLNWALDYAENGYFVFQLQQGGKQPNGNCPPCDRKNKGRFQETLHVNNVCTAHPNGMAICHGHLAATRDPEVITAWWTSRPHCNIGINMGRSGMAVVDVDTALKADGTHKVGDQTMARLAETYGLMPAGPMVRTRSGGWQYYLTHPNGMILKSSAGRDDHLVGLGQDVDIKAESAYTVAPPSIITDDQGLVTGQYTWVNDPWQPRPDVPAWLPQEIEKRQEAKRPQRPTSWTPSQYSGSDATTDEVRQHVISLADEVARTPEGARNDTLFRQCAKAHDYAAAGQIDPNEVDDIFISAGLNAGLDRSGVIGTVASARNRPDRRPYIWQSRTSRTSTTPNEGQDVTETVGIPEQRSDESVNNDFFEILRSFSPDHLGLAEYFHEIQDGKSYVRWDSGSCTFVVYRQDRGHWQRDDAKSTILGQMISRLAKRVRTATDWAILNSPANAIIEAAKGGAEVKKEQLAEAKADIKAMRGWYNVLANAGGHHSVVKMLSTLIESTMPGEFDSRSYLMNFKNGTYDVRTGELHEHTADDMLVHRVEHNLDLSLAREPLSVVAPHFHKLITRMCAAPGEVDEDTAHGRYSAVTRFFGYLMHGSNPEKLLGAFEGGTNTGKNQAVETVGSILGSDLAWLAGRPELLTKGRNQRHDSEEYSVAGKRMVLVNELDKNQHLDENQVLRFVNSEGTVVALRRMRQDREDVPVTWTMVITTNELPKARLTPQVIGRLRLFPLSQISVPREEWYDIKGTVLAQEAEAVLAHLVTWWRDWYIARVVERSETGLIITPEMENALTTYQADNTSLHQQYFEEELEYDPEYSATPKEIWNGFTNWMRTENPGVDIRYEIKRPDFTKELQKLPNTVCVNESIGGGRTALRRIKGVRVRRPEQPKTWMEMQAIAR